MISVIVPTFNRAPLLPRALDSVFEQSLQPSEVILVDDGSTDTTRQLVEQCYPSVHYLHQTNRGVSCARNLGIAHASGEWLAFLDSDDVWLPDKLATQTSALTASPGYRLCHTEEIWIRNGRRVNPMKKHAKSGGWIFRRCLRQCVISPSSVLIHRSLLQTLGLFDEDLPACEDYDLWLRICARQPVLFVNTPQIVKHGGHVDQLSRRYWGMDRYRIQALEKIITDGILLPEDHAAACEILIEKAQILVQGAEKRGHDTQAEKYRAKLRSHGRLLRQLDGVHACEKF